MFINLRSKLQSHQNRPDWRNTARAATAGGSDLGPNVEVKKEKKEECAFCLVSIILKKVITFPLKKVRTP